VYPRNAASPERIAIGAVVQISDGAVQGSGVTVTVRGQGGAEGAGGGTIAFGATGVIVYYTPLQAETDFTSFVVIASKTGCIPVSVTVVTSASATPGNAGLDWGKVINPTTVVGLSGTTVKTATDVETDTADIQTRLPAALTAGGNMKSDALALSGDTTAADNAEAFFDGTGYAGTNNVIPLVTVTTTLTNLPTIPANWLTAAGTAADFSTEVNSAVLAILGTPAGASMSADIAAVKVDTAAILDDTGTSGVVVAAASKTGYLLAATGSAALTEGYAADGAAFTLNQGLYMIWSLLAERAISSTTLTASKLDGATPAMTFTLDSATTPATQTRAT
jgi:hypothetical protein